MPADVAFDTMAVVRRLRDAGIDQAHAEAITASIQSGVTGGVATKADIIELRTGDIAELRSEIAELRVGLRWVTGIGAGIVVILVGAFGFVYNMLVGMTADIATLQTILAAQGADIAAIKEALTALADR